MTESSWACVNGLRFRIGRAGRGPLLLFLGGTGSDLRHQPNVLDSVLTESFHVVTYDQRGMGQSDKPPGPYAMADYANDVKGLLDDWGCASVSLVGYSFGGMVAQEFAVTWPEKVARLVLIASSAGGAAGASYPIETLLGDMPLERAERSLAIADLSFTSDWIQANPQRAAERVESMYQRQNRFLSEPGALDGLKAQLTARAGHDCSERLHRINAPTLVLAGRQDGQAPLDNQRAMASLIPGAQFETHEGSHLAIGESDALYRRAAAFCLLR